MSIVGTQSVSMSDLMKLGVPALNSMAQGQQQSIAPSYMVLAALKALTDAQKGQMQQMPQGTVKDQVVAQTAPPIQAGIGQMMPPVQKMAGGGEVESFRQAEFDDPDWTLFDLRTDAQKAAARRNGPLFDLRSQAQKEAQRRGRYPQSDVEGGRGKVIPTATVATAPESVPIDYGAQYIKDAISTPEKTPGAASPDGISGSISASARQRGVGGMGTSPLAKYATLGPTAKPGDFKLDIPKNQQLADAAAKFATPDAARMAELKSEEQRAGLGAFARGMLDTSKGRGFGAVFGRAAADASDAMTTRADKRREYEDRREALATQLGIQLGSEAKQDFLTKTEYGDKRADKSIEQAQKTLEINNQRTHYQNSEIIDREKAHLMAEANRIAAEARRDGLTAAHHDRIQKLYLTAQEIAIKAAESKFGKTDPMLAQTPAGATREQQKQEMYEAEYAKAVSDLERRLGGEGNSKAAGTATIVRKAY